MNSTATVPVKSAWSSKVNWVAGASVAATAAIGFVGALHLDPVTTTKVVTVISALGSFATIILRTWFSGSVVTGSLPS